MSGSVIVDDKKRTNDERSGSIKVRGVAVLIQNFTDKRKYITMKEYILVFDYAIASTEEQYTSGKKYHDRR